MYKKDSNKSNQIRTSYSFFPCAVDANIFLHTQKSKNLSRQTKGVIQNTNEQSENRKDDRPLMRRRRHLRRFSASGKRGFSHRCQSASRPRRSRSYGIMWVFLPLFLLFIFVFVGRYLYLRANTPGDDSTAGKHFPRGPLGDVRGPGGG